MRIGLTIMVCLVLLAGCSGVDQEEYDKLAAEKTNITKEFDVNKKALNDLKSEYDSYKQVTKDWLELSDADKKKLTSMISKKEEIVMLDSEINQRKDQIKDLDNKISQLEDKIQTYQTTKQLGIGQYIVGEDIGAGKYDVFAIKGLGNFQGAVESLGSSDYSLNEILAEKGSDSAEKMSNLRLSDGDNFVIKGNLILEFKKIY